MTGSLPSGVRLQSGCNSRPPVARKVIEDSEKQTRLEGGEDDDDVGCDKIRYTIFGISVRESGIGSICYRMEGGREKGGSG